jgi:phosphatidylglycerol---prolipoprotein diacylglyceryl transferase
MVFPKGGDVGRHPSQLYEAFLEGLLLYFVLRFLYTRLHKTPGVVFGCFIFGYGCARFIAEYFRMPENLSWIESDWFSGGQILSLSMIFVGVGIVVKQSCSLANKRCRD